MNIAFDRSEKLFHFCRKMSAGKTLNKPLIVRITGPESTGKTTLSGLLARLFNGYLVEEVARAYLENKSGYTEADLRAIAKMQAAKEDESIRLASPGQFVFCDTGPEVIKIWSEYRFGRCHSDIEQLVRERTYAHTLLLYPDIDWQPDPLRENPQDREELFELYKSLLDRLHQPYTIITGRGKQRTTLAEKVISRLAEKNNP